MTETNDQPQDLLTTLDAAALIGVHPNTIRGWIKSGELRAWRYGSRLYRVAKADVLGMLKPVQVGEPASPTVPEWVEKELRKAGIK